MLAQNLNNIKEKTMKNLVLCLSLGLFVLSCNQNRSEVSIKDKDHIDVISEEDLESNDDLTSFNWEGVYEGVLPCASCPGIETELTLSADNTYTLKTFYQENPDSENIEQGKFEWVADSDIIQLDNADETQFKIENQQIRQLNPDGEMIEGNLAEFYVLKKKNE